MRIFTSIYSLTKLIAHIIRNQRCYKPKEKNLIIITEKEIVSTSYNYICPPFTILNLLEMHRKQTHVQVENASTSSLTVKAKQGRIQNKKPNKKSSRYIQGSGQSFMEEILRTEFPKFPRIEIQTNQRNKIIAQIILTSCNSLKMSARLFDYLVYAYNEADKRKQEIRPYQHAKDSRE